MATKKKKPSSVHSTPTKKIQFKCTHCNVVKTAKKFHATEREKQKPTCKSCIKTFTICTLCRDAKPDGAYDENRRKSSKPACNECVTIHVDLGTTNVLPAIDWPVNHLSDKKEEVAAEAEDVISEETFDPPPWTHLYCNKNWRSSQETQWRHMYKL